MDTVTAILVQALKDALGRAEEQPLYKSGKQPGLFAARTGPAGEAAQAALRDGLLEPVRGEARGKAETEFVRLTPRGVQFVYQHESPKAVLEELVAALRPNRDGVPRWLEEMRAQLQGLTNRWVELLERQQRYLDQLARRAEEALRRLNGPAAGSAAPVEPWQLDALDYLDRRKVLPVPADCPLAELFNALRGTHPGLALAAFHEGLVRLRDRGAVALLPFAGPLAALAEPEYALLEGAAVFYAVTRT
jgi:hypothetical protein